MKNFEVSLFSMLLLFSCNTPSMVSTDSSATVDNIPTCIKNMKYYKDSMGVCFAYCWESSGAGVGKVGGPAISFVPPGGHFCEMSESKT